MKIRHLMAGLLALLVLAPTAWAGPGKKRGNAGAGLISAQTGPELARLVRENPKLIRQLTDRQFETWLKYRNEKSQPTADYINAWLSSHGFEDFDDFYWSPGFREHFRDELARMKRNGIDLDYVMTVTSNRIIIESNPQASGGPITAAGAAETTEKVSGIAKELWEGIDTILDFSENGCIADVASQNPNMNPDYVVFFCETLSLECNFFADPGTNMWYGCQSVNALNWVEEFLEADERKGDIAKFNGDPNSRCKDGYEYIPSPIKFLPGSCVPKDRPKQDEDRGGAGGHSRPGIDLNDDSLLAAAIVSNDCINFTRQGSVVCPAGSSVVTLPDGTVTCRFDDDETVTTPPPPPLPPVDSDVCIRIR